MAQQEDSKREEFAKEFMVEEGLKGKARRIKIMKIIEKVGYDKRKIKFDTVKKINNDTDL